MTARGHHNFVVFDEGCGPADPADALDLALRVRAAALEAGFTPVSFRRSRHRGSTSTYIRAHDDDRVWLIRVSDHAFVIGSPSARPHLDLVSRDGRSGFEKAALHLAMMKAGEVEWWDTLAERRPKPMKRRPKHHANTRRRKAYV